MAARAGGAEWEGIADAHGISARQAQRIYAAGSARSPALDRDPLDLACAVVAEYNAAVEELRVPPVRPLNDGTRLGAVRARIGAPTDGLDEGSLWAATGRTGTRWDIVRTTEGFGVIVANWNRPDWYADTLAEAPTLAEERDAAPRSHPRHGSSSRTATTAG